MTQHAASIQFSAPQAKEEWDRLIGELATKAGIADVATLQVTLIIGLAKTKIYDEGGGTAQLPGWRYVPISARTEAAGHRIASLISDLEAELAAIDTPISKIPETAQLRASLAAYGASLEAIKLATKAGRANDKPKLAESILVIHLAKAWPELTGEIPKATRKHDTNEPSGKFYLLINDVCRTFGRKTPSVDVVRDALRHIGFLPPKKAQ